jgi:hypothetical protein
MTELEILKQQLVRINRELETLNQQVSLENQDLMEKLRELMAEYEKDVYDLIEMLPYEHELLRDQYPGSLQTVARKPTTYLNPHTRKSVTTIGTSSGILRSWISQYGGTEVQGWAQQDPPIKDKGSNP